MLQPALWMLLPNPFLLAQAREALPLVVYAGAAALRISFPPTVRAPEGQRASPRALALLVNGLNVADALLTAFALRYGEAVEANPVVQRFGLPVKVALVLVITWVLARRPRALIWPALIVVAVICWHVNGLYLEAHA